MFLYSTFRSVGPELLHQAFLRAFSDYQVKMELPFPDFEQMLRRRGYCPELSVGGIFPLPDRIPRIPSTSRRKRSFLPVAREIYSGY